MAAGEKIRDVNSRRAYIDWLRGFAVLIMVEWHAVNAWTLESEHAGLPYQTLGFIGGWAAPLFLFLAGLAVPFAGQALMRRGKTLREAAWALQKRGWQIFLLAHLFRFQSYVLNPWAVWHSILKPDILNILGLGLVLTAFCWGRMDSIRGRMAWLLTPVVIVMVFAPLSRTWWWPTLLHPRFEAYIRPNGSFGVFTLFPWIAFVLVGAVIGVWIARQRARDEEGAFHLRLAGVGAAIIAAGYVGMGWPSPLGTSFWTTSLSYFLMRVGVMILLLCLAWVWLRRPTAARWSPMVVFGQTSLFVYWIHVELAFGLFSTPIHKSLTVNEALFAWVIFTGALLAAAVWWQRWQGQPWVPARFVPKTRAVAAAVVVATLAGATMVTAQDSWRPVVVRLPPGVSIGALSSCQTVTGLSVLRPSTAAPGAADAQCSLTSVARCAIPGTEPLDIDLGSLCRGGIATIVAAPREVVPTWPAREPAVVEWRVWNESASIPVATRVIDPASTPTLPVAADDRLLRVVRAGASPVTVIAPASESRSGRLAVDVPASTAGGELFLFLDSRERAFAHVTLAGPTPLVVGVNGATYLSVPGLAPGTYTLTFGTAEAPEGTPVAFRIVDESTTELAPRLPPGVTGLRVHGHVTLNGAPMPGQTLHVVHLQSDRTTVVTTDDEGRYQVPLEIPGAYVVRVVAGHDLGHLEKAARVEPGGTRVDLELTGAPIRVQVIVEGNMPTTPVEVLIIGTDVPHRFRAMISDFSQTVEFAAIPPGTYSVRASTEPDLVAASSVTIDQTPGVRTAVLDLRAQRATLRVAGESGQPVEGARARTEQQILRPTGGGAFDVQRLPPGTAVVVRAPGHATACAVLAPDIENLVRLRSTIAPLQFRFESTVPRVPPGFVKMGAADACAIPLAEFDWRRTEQGFEVTNLPANVPLIFERGTISQTIRAPGETVVIK